MPHLDVMNRTASLIQIRREISGQWAVIASILAGGQDRLSLPIGTELTAEGPGPTPVLLSDFEVNDRGIDTWEVTAEFPPLLPLPLTSLGGGDYSESLVPKDRFLRAERPLRSVMLFVDFLDVRAAKQDWAVLSKARKRLTEKVNSQLSQHSLGRAELKFEFASEWRRMSKNSTSYANDRACGCISTTTRTKEYVEEAAGLFENDFVFSDFDIVYIVAAKTPKIAISPAWVAEEGDPAISASGEIRFAVTFGNDSYDNPDESSLLLHETYHLLGLPDLYDGGKVTDPQGGWQGFQESGLEAWDLMAGPENGVALLGWHRLKLGWLSRSQVLLLQRPGEKEFELTDWSQPEGIKGLMIAGSAVPDLKDTSLAYLIEVTPPKLPAGASAGILIYSVNSSVPSWERPIQMRGGPDGISVDPIGIGGSFSHLSGGFTVAVLRATSNGFRVKVKMG